MPRNQVQPADKPQFDLSPWTSTPSSSRVSRFRYDHANRETQVQWTNGKGNGYVYRGMEYEQFRLFARAASKGKKVNEFLNAFPYEPMTAEEYSAPSNTSRRGLQSRVQ